MKAFRRMELQNRRCVTASHAAATSAASRLAMHTYGLVSTASRQLARPAHVCGHRSRDFYSLAVTPYVGRLFVSLVCYITCENNYNNCRGHRQGSTVLGGRGVAEEDGAGLASTSWRACEQRACEFPGTRPSSALPFLSCQSIVWRGQGGAASRAHRPRCPSGSIRMAPYPTARSGRAAALC